MLLRPLPEYDEFFGYGIAIAYLEASGETVTAAYEPWRDLITDIRQFRADVHGVADRMRRGPATRGDHSRPTSLRGAVLGAVPSGGSGSGGAARVDGFQRLLVQSPQACGQHGLGPGRTAPAGPAAACSRSAQLRPVWPGEEFDGSSGAAFRLQRAWSPRGQTEAPAARTRRTSPLHSDGSRPASSVARA
ncbi:hypothetical protein GCM10010331_70320 [Streptomyces xanthochromogenes]|nr:hypothetical protein GCM10010331_70320 [Streptomyces xanthochromogenes]